MRGWQVRVLYGPQSKNSLGEFLLCGRRSEVPAGLEDLGDILASQNQQGVLVM